MSNPKSQNDALHVVTEPDMPLGACVEQYLAAISSVSVTTYDTLAKAAEGAGAARVLLAITSPVESLARRLIDTKTSMHALDAWKAEAVTLLAQARRMRRQLVLADARSLLSNDAEVLAILEIEKTPVAAFTDTPPLPDPMILVLADALLSNDQQASRLVAEIEAMRHGSQVVLLGIEQVNAAHEGYLILIENPKRLQVAQAQAADYRARLENLELARTALIDENALLRDNIACQISAVDKAGSEKSAALAEHASALETLREQHDVTLEENALLRENISQHIAGAEDAVGLRAQLMAECDSLRKVNADRHVMKAQAEALGRRIETQKESAALREAVLGAVMLEDQKSLANAMAQTAGREAYAQGLAGELERVYRSRSWRLTSPLRKVRSGRGKT